MKIIIQTLFVYIPFGICVLMQVFAWLSLHHSSNQDKAFLIKIIFPVLLLIATVLHFLIKEKDEV